MSSFGSIADRTRLRYSVWSCNRIVNNALFHSSPNVNRRCLKSSTFTPCTFVSLYCAPDVFNRMEVIASFFLYRLLCVSSQVSAFSSARCRAGKTDRESCHWTIFNNMHHRLLWCTTVTTSWICDMNKWENEWILLVELHCEPENINQNCSCNIIYKT